jgi:hypothetical protein
VETETGIMLFFKDHSCMINFLFILSMQDNFECITEVFGNLFLPSQGDLQALEDLTYEKRKDFIRKHPLPKELPVVSFHTEAGITPTTLTTLSHVAHFELPAIAPSLTDSQPTRLPVVVPLAATMAACSQLLQIRHEIFIFKLSSSFFSIGP